MNLNLAHSIAQGLANLGVKEICVCAGARNSPLVVLLSGDPYFRKFHFFEERSAAFFALGRIKSHGSPVAVVTTSGTAVAELLPATIEAHYTNLPLILVTADRPKRYRGTGAPQSIEQFGIFGPYVRFSVDREAFDHPLDISPLLFSWQADGPLQLNVCFEEPLLDRPLSENDKIPAMEPPRPRRSRYSESTSAVLDGFLSRSRSPLVIVGGLLPHQAGPVRAFLLRLGAPCFLEAASGLREDERLENLKIHSSERVLNPPSERAYRNPFDSVLRIGGVPTLRFWRDLDDRRRDLKVLSISDSPFAGSVRSELITTELAEFFESYRVTSFRDPSSFQDLRTRDLRKKEEISSLLLQEADSEPGMIRQLSRLIPAASRVYLGNSLPIREWDLASSREAKDFRIAANRGANGIDGQLSSFLGFSEPGCENWALVGDLTALYDLSSPWILAQLPELRVRIAVMNNGGGRIFSRMFESPIFQNRHEIGFRSWAEMWGLYFEKWPRIPESFENPANAVLELVPDADSTSRFWEAFDQLWKKD